MVFVLPAHYLDRIRAFFDNKVQAFARKHTRQAMGAGAFCERGGRCTPVFCIKKTVCICMCICVIFFVFIEHFFLLLDKYRTFAQTIGTI